MLARTLSSGLSPDVFYFPYTENIPKFRKICQGGTGKKMKIKWDRFGVEDEVFFLTPYGKGV